MPFCLIWGPTQVFCFFFFKKNYVVKSEQGLYEWRKEIQREGKELAPVYSSFKRESQDVMPHLLTTLLSFSVNAAMMLVYK